MEGGCECGPAEQEVADMRWAEKLQLHQRGTNVAHSFGQII